MNTEAIKKSVRDYIIENTFASKEKIADDTLIVKEGFLDSMGLVMLVTFLEETFNIKTKDEDMVEENFESINAITAYIQNNLS